MRLSPVLRAYALPALFFALGIPLCAISGVTFSNLVNELIFRITQHGILVLALLPTLQAGMGFNFATGLGIWSAQTGFMIAAAYGLPGAPGTGVALVLGLLLAAGLGSGIGWLLSRMPGLEMLMTLFLVQLLMFPLWWVTSGIRAVLPAPPPGRVSRYLDSAYVDLTPFRHALDFQVQVGQILVPVGTLVLLAAATVAILGFQKLQRSKTVPGMSESVISPRIKITAFTLSLMLACVSRSVVLQTVPMLMPHHAFSSNVVPIIPALIAGGALLDNAKLHHAFLGVLALNLLFIPLATTAWDGAEIVRTMVSSGLMLFALLQSPRFGRTESQSCHEPETPA